MRITMAGRLTAADTTGRTLVGTLYAHGEPGRTSLGLATFDDAWPKLPADPSTVVLNLDHDRTRPVGRAVTLEHQTTEAGPAVTVASFTIPHTPNGDRLLAEAAAGLRPGLSVEVDGAVIRSGRLTAGTITAVGAVVEPAFPSGQITELLTAADTEPADAPAVTVPGPLPVPDPAQPEPAPEPAPVPAPTPEPEDPDVDPLTPKPATAPAGLTAAAPKPDRLTGEITSPRDFSERLAEAHARQDTRLIAALQNITATAVLADVSPTSWVGELWTKRAYERMIVPLLTPGTLTGMKVTGWRWNPAPTVAAWAGDKTAVPSNAATTEPIEALVERLAGAHDHDRAMRDFPNPDYWDSYYAAMTDSYARLSDGAAVADLVAAATTTTPGTVPAGVDKGWAAIVDGALAVLPYGSPSFAVVAPDLFRGLLLTPTDKGSEYLSASLGLEGGNLGGFRIVPWATLTASTVIVGAREAIQFLELPGVPIRAEAVDMVLGGIDTGVFGYYATVIHNAAGIRKVTAV